MLVQPHSGPSGELGWVNCSAARDPKVCDQHALGVLPQGTKPPGLPGEVLMLVQRGLAAVQRTQRRQVRHANA